MASTFYKQLNYTERRTFKLHLLYSIIEGYILGILALNEFVFIRSMKGSDYQLSILFQLTSVLLIFAIVFHELQKRILDKRKMLRIVGWITRLPLALLIFFPSNASIYTSNGLYHYIFLFIFLLYYIANPIIYPTINQLLKNNYKHEHFGRLYGRSTIWNKMVMMIVTFAYGLLLDYDYYAFRYIFPFTAFLGIFSVYILTRIRFQKQKTLTEKQNLSASIKESIKGMFQILKQNKPYRHFEIGFMFYGFAFMSTISVITLFFSKELDMNYTSVAFYKNGYNIIAILLLPLFGRLIGKIDPRKFAAITFLSMFFVLFFLVLTEHFPFYTWVYHIKLYYALIFYMLAHGLFASTMGLLWSIGSVYFCKNEHADMYQAVHLTLTGERALFAPFLGVLFLNLFGFTITFLIGCSSLFIGILVMIWSLKKEKKIMVD